SDSAAVEELALENYDVVLVAIGEDVQASLLCVVHLKTLGIQNVWVKASSHAQHLILNKLGVARIIHPEEEMGLRVAQALSYPMVNDYISLGNGEFVVEITVSERLDGVALSQIFPEGPETPRVMLVKHRSQTTVHPPTAHIVHAKDVVVMFGTLDSLRAMAPRLASYPMHALDPRRSLDTFRRIQRGGNVGASPPALLAGGFLALIVIGTALLWLPFAAKPPGLSLFEAFFTATAAVTITGLTIVEPAQLSLFGQWVIIILA